MLLMFDEIQTGMGRTGTLFAYEQIGVVPDVMTLAKALGERHPDRRLPARARRSRRASTLGAHGSTFGGNAVAAAAAVATLETMLADGVPRRACARAARTSAPASSALAARRPRDRRGARPRPHAGDHARRARRAGRRRACLARGLLINCTAERVLRLLPPLVITDAEIDRGLAILDEVLRSRDGGPAT